jgi:hypothetical protein
MKAFGDGALSNFHFPKVPPPGGVPAGTPSADDPHAPVSSKSLSERGVEQVAQRAAQAVNRPRHDDIELPPAGVLEHGIEARPSVSSLGA